MAKPIFSCNFNVNNSGSIPCVIGGPLALSTSTLVSDTGKNGLKIGTGVPSFPVALPNGVPNGVSATFWSKSVVTPASNFTSIYDTPGWIEFDLNVSGTVKMYSTMESGTGVSVGTPAAVGTTWHHYGFSLINGTITYYMDGVLKGTSTTSDYPPSNQVFSTLNISSSGGSNGGIIDDLRIYSEVIALADVTYDMANLPTNDASRPATVVQSASSSNSTADGKHSKLGGTVDLHKSNMDLLNVSLAGDIQKYGYGYAIIKNWGTPGVDSVTSARRKHAGATNLETIQDAEKRYWNS